MDPPQLVFSARDEPPFPVDALVEEEDSYLSMSVEPVLTLPDEHPLRVMTDAREAKEVEPGTIVVRRRNPLKLLAVVHRLHERPTWREAWVIEAIGNLCVEVERRQIHALGTPLLGTVHGKMNAQRSFELLSPLLTSGTALRRVWVMTRKEFA